MSFIVIGFTGTREGLTEKQALTFNHFMQHLNSKAALRFLHGMCIGADEQAGVIVDNLGINIEGFPCTMQGVVNHKYLSKIRPAIVHKAKKPLDRNEDIVDRSDVLIACPRSRNLREPRSGTCYTIRYALSIKKPTYIIYPDGETEPHFTKE